MRARSSQARASSTSASPSPGSATDGSARRTNGGAASSESGGRGFPSMTTSGQLALGSSSEWTSSPEGFPARAYRVLGVAAGSIIPRLSFGGKWPDAFASFDPGTCSWRTLQTSLTLRGGELFGEVLGDLASSGYDAWWDCLPASAFGAPHRRDRVFVIAYAGRGGLEGQSSVNGPQPSIVESHAQRPDLPVEWGEYEAAVRRWEDVLGRCAPEPVLRGVDAGPAGRVVRSRLSALGAGVQVQAGWFLGRMLIGHFHALETGCAKGVPSQKEREEEDNSSSGSSPGVAL